MSTIAVAGKGGSGKTTVSGTLARILARTGHEVWAIDADSTPNLATTLGLSSADAAAIMPMPRTILEETRDADGKRVLTLAMTPAAVVEQYGVSTPDAVKLLVMGRVTHAGVGCLCGAHAAVRHLLGGLIQAPHPITIVDMEAGLEHLSRGTARHVDTLLVILEPYYKALETARQAAQLGRDLGVQRILGVANKIRDDADAAAVREFAQSHGIPLVAEVPLDDRIRKADLAGRAPIDVPDSPAVVAIAALAATLV